MISAVASHQDVVAVRLINRKITYIDRQLWNPLISVGNERAPWQLEPLSRAASALFKRVTRTGSYVTTESRDIKAAGKAAAELERVLLITGREVHTETGAHAKLLQSWDYWCESRAFPLIAMPPAQARTILETAAKRLLPTTSVRIRLPWGVGGDVAGSGS